MLAVLGCIPIAIVHASLFEWVFHRYWLHRPWLPKDVFTAHTLVHHQLCKFDDTFHVVDEEQHDALTFQWWGGPFLIAINSALWALIMWGLSALGIMAFNPMLLVVVAVVFAIYYAGYEGLHYLMHKPGIAWIENSGYFKFLERHHRIHHVQMDRNLNVLLPVGDFLLGTLVLEAKTAGTTSAKAREIARQNSRRAGPPGTPHDEKRREHSHH